MTAHMELLDPKLVYSSEELAQIDLSRIPKHIAIIMDGNRRWARQKNLPLMMGHREGAEALSDVLRAASELGVRTITVYTFSTETWNRSEGEVDDLMNLFELYLIRKKEPMVRDGVKLHAIGDLSRLPERVLKSLDQAKQATEHCEKINLVLALNYGGRDEIRRAFVKILQEGVTPDQITEQCIADHLDTCSFGDPELLIRTSGEMRVSNFLLWQISYAEIVSTDVLWPDFSSKELLEAITIFQKRNRRLGA